MINLELTNYQAIQIDSLLGSLSLLATKSLPDSTRQEIAAGFSSNLELKSVAEKLRAELDSLVQTQQLADSSQVEPDDDWNKPEDLKPLNIQSPPDWNDYNEYLLEGGKLEYSEWRLQRLAELTQIPGNIFNQSQICGDAKP
jgi:hypothetical protein